MCRNGLRVNYAIELKVDGVMFYRFEIVRRMYLSYSTELGFYAINILENPYS